jgi:hypothetical protein
VHDLFGFLPPHIFRLSLQVSHTAKFPRTFNFIMLSYFSFIRALLREDPIKRQDDDEIISMNDL